MDSKGDKLAHLMKLWTDKYALTGETKGGHIPLHYKKFVVTSNYSIRRIFGPREHMSDEEKEDAEVMASAIERRFKVIRIESRQDSQYWMEHINDELFPK